VGANPKQHGIVRAKARVFFLLLDTRHNLPDGLPAEGMAVRNTGLSDCGLVLKLKSD